MLYRGMIRTPSCETVVQEARTLVETTGDLLLRFSLESNYAVGLMDIGDLDRAEILMSNAAELLGSADMQLHRLNQAYNRGELALSQQAYAQATRHLQEAATYVNPSAPSYMRDLVNAGLGLCAIQSGSLAEARRREGALPDPPETWYYDPTMIVAFRARLLTLRGQHSEADEVLARAEADLQGRLITAWLKVRLQRVRLTGTENPRLAQNLALEGKAQSDQLRLAIRSSEFARLLDALT